MVIKILDEKTINKIAAGEVIERPSSVVKELIENSIDANAENIIVEIKEGGIQSIRVSDDGLGMNEEDALLCFKKHATSKLNNLFDIHTLGFRGEALSSISSVSKFTLKTSNGNEGIEIILEGGIVKSKSKTGMNKGTIIVVEDLFYNTPARKNYLKSKDLEFSHIKDIIIRYSFSNNNISFKLIHDNKTILNIPKTNNLLNKIVNVYGKDIARNSIEIKEDFITGYIGKPYITKSDRSMQTIFINSRYIKNEIISKAIYDAYHTLLFLDRHPFVILNLKIDFTKIDVNVHPTKEVIRLENENEIYQNVFNVIKKTFQENNLIPEVEIDTENNKTVKQNYYVSQDTQTTLSYDKSNNEGLVQNKLNNNLSIKERTEPYDVLNNQENNTGFVDLGVRKIIGQLNKMYIIAEGDNGLLLIDQHALEERINYEKLMSQIKNNAIKIQSLLTPMIIELGTSEFDLFEKNKELLTKMGFKIEEYGPNTIILRTLPKLFSNLDETKIKQILYDLKNFKNMNQEEIENAIARKACRMSIKAGKELTLSEMKSLIEESKQCEKPYSCPHGRPTIINISFRELEKKFKRTV